MKAVVFHGIGDIRLDEVREPKIEASTDAIVRLTASAICGTDLHMIRGTMPGMKPGTILGHEGIGMVEEIGKDVRNLNKGDRVVIPSTIACGYCSYCRAGYFAQCDHANPNGAQAGTAFFGGPEKTGPFHGLQAEFARIPFAHCGLVKLPPEISDEQAILLSDIFPTGYFGADIAEIESGDTVAIFGCGPVGQFVIASARLMDAGRIFAIDTIPSRLDMARAQGAEVIDFNAEDPVEAIRRLTGGIGVDRAIDAVGVDAMAADHGPARKSAKLYKAEFEREMEQVAPKTNPKGDNWRPGGAPSQACFFRLGQAMGKNLTVQMGNCHHRKYIPILIDLVRSGTVEPTKVLTQVEPLASAIDAYKAFDQRLAGWVKVELKPGKAA
jgi:threonine dehydrogenase-like Zn-dependent dehydrogenase